MMFKWQCWVATNDPEFLYKLADVMKGYTEQKFIDLWTYWTEKHPQYVHWRMMTLTHTSAKAMPGNDDLGCQLRLWDSVSPVGLNPHNLNPTHVDSGGKNLIVEVRGDFAELGALAERLLNGRRFRKDVRLAESWDHRFGNITVWEIHG